MGALLHRSSPPAFDKLRDRTPRIAGSFGRHISLARHGQVRGPSHPAHYRVSALLLTPVKLIDCSSVHLCVWQSFRTISLGERDLVHIFSVKIYLHPFVCDPGLRQTYVCRKV